MDEQKIKKYNRSQQTMLEQEIDGVPHVTIPKELWDRMWAVIDRIDQIGE